MSFETWLILGMCNLYIIYIYIYMLTFKGGDFCFRSFLKVDVSLVESYLAGTNGFFGTRFNGRFWFP